MKIGELRGAAGDHEGTVGMRRQVGGGELSLTVGPDAVDATFSLSRGDSEVIIHAGESGQAEAMVRAAGGELRYYRLDHDLNPRDDIPGAEGDINMIRSAAAMLANELGSIRDLDGYERFNPFDEAGG